MSLQVRGVWVAMATPLLEDHSIDREAFVRLADHLISAGVHGLFLFGSTGEGPAIPLAEKASACRLLTSHVGNRIPVIAGSLLGTTALVMEEVRALQQTGIAGLVVTTPYFYRPDHDESLMLHFQAIGQTARIPLIAYNVPSRTGSMLSVDEIDRIRSTGSYVGVKDSSLNFAHMQSLIDAKSRWGGFSVTDGSEENWVASCFLGADGATLGIANVCPRWCVQAWNLAKSGHIADAQRVNKQVLAIRDAVFKNSSVYGGLKEALHHLGFGGRTVSLPMTSLRVEERERLATRLAAADFNEPVRIDA